MIFDLTSHFQDGDHDVISLRKVLLPGECTYGVGQAHAQQHPPGRIHKRFLVSVTQKVIK